MNPYLGAQLSVSVEHNNPLVNLKNMTNWRITHFLLGKLKYHFNWAIFYANCYIVYQRVTIKVEAYGEIFGETAFNDGIIGQQMDAARKSTAPVVARLCHAIPLY